MTPQEKLIAARDVLVFLSTLKTDSNEDIEILSLALKAICRRLMVKDETSVV